MLLITTRIYAQGYQAVPLGNVPTSGVQTQLSADSAFRTEIGVMNSAMSPSGF